jgi:hypothetical protein
MAECLDFAIFLQGVLKFCHTVQLFINDYFQGVVLSLVHFGVE